MDGDENPVALAIGDGAALAEADKGVVAARHDHPITRRREPQPDALGHVEGIDFFRVRIAGHPAAVVTAVTGIEDDSGERFHRVGGGKKNREKEGEEGA